MEKIEDIYKQCRQSLLTFLAGNEYQNFASAIGNKPFIRNRSQGEFNTEGGMTKDELINLLLMTRAESTFILSNLSKDDLQREVIIRYDLNDWNRMHRVNASEDETYDVSVISRLLIQVGAHYGYHAGQIVLLSKLMIDIDENITGQYH
ncbi:hypothetical protein ACIQXF_01825 [Lysinibacillus sp. NPDC097231]|uniref:hypothetical protein n=1 Tax=Lysinibacillus sp. NPDC097231 TaxID=3364142 RepID=UPI0038061CF6